MKKPIIVLTGPTASGKTALSFDLARKFNVEIICADSMTVYRGMDIGTDKPTLGKEVKKNGNEFEIDGVIHHLIDVKNPDEEMNVAIFKAMAKTAIQKIQQKNKIPLIVGGSTLYIDALVYDFQMPEVKPDPELRAELEQKSNEDLFQQLVKLDPDCEWTIDKNNKRRLIRALEVVLETGQPFCASRSRAKLPKNVLYLALKRDREWLYNRIDQRVDEMIESGFLEEVKKLYQKYDHNTAMQAAGYKQLTEYLDEKLTLDEAVEKTKQVHRNFAKRQMTWLKRNKDIEWIENQEQAEKLVENFFKIKN